MANRIWCVYLHTNLTNGKCYVGITSQYPVEKRWKNGLGYQTQPKFYSAIQEFGWDGFDHKITETGLTESEAREKEQEYITFFDSIDNGYNSTLGGGKPRGGGKPVMIVETGNIYEDANQAAEVYLVSADNIRHACRSGYATAGYHWRYATQEDLEDAWLKTLGDDEF